MSFSNMDQPAEISFVAPTTRIEEHSRGFVLKKFDNRAAAEVEAKKTSGMVVKEKDQKIYYVFPNIPATFQVVSVEQD